jgi:hypothetical protein
VCSHWGVVCNPEVVRPAHNLYSCRPAAFMHVVVGPRTPNKRFAASSKPGLGSLDDKDNKAQQQHFTERECTGSEVRRWGVMCVQEEVQQVLL